MPTIRIAVHSGEVARARGVKGRAVDELLGVGATARPGKPAVTNLVRDLDG
jgi:hypothetical protein